MYFAAKPFPHQIMGAATVVPFGDSILLVGGRLGESTYYNPDEDSWTLLESRMKEKNDHVVAMMVDRDMFE